MDNVIWLMALLELGILALLVGIVVWAIRKKPAKKPDQNDTTNSE